MRVGGMEKTTLKQIPAFYRKLLILGGSVAAVAFVFFLLFMNYRFAVDLRGTNLKNMKAETEKRAASIGFFFADRRDDLINLALSREISVFFENKALGMSMEYGLKYSLAPILDRFQDLVNRKKLGSDAVYSRIMLIERSGAILVDTLTATGHKGTREGLQELLVPNYRDGTILSVDGGKEIVVSLSYFFKNRYDGQIIAWIQPQTLYKNIIGEGGSPSDISILITNEGKTFQSVGVSFPSQIAGLPNLAALTPGEPSEFRDLNGERQSWIGLKTPINGTPFHLLRLIAASNVVGKLTPQYLLTTMGVIALVLLGGAVFTIILTVRAKEALRESERLMSEIIDFLPDATLVIDKEGRVITWNRAIESMTGVKAEAMLGRGNYEYALPFYGERRPILIDLALHPDREKEKTYTTIQRMGDIIFIEGRLPALRPGNVHLSATASVLRDSGGDIIGAIECIRNDTDRKRMEERLQRAEKMEALGVLAGGVAHDLNNVLGVLVGYSELLLREVPEGSRAGRFAKSILQGGERAAAIIQDLLTMARRGVSVSETINMNRIVSDFFKSPEFERITQHHPDVLFRSQLEADLFNIKGSPVHLFKTIMNLLANAAESISGAGEVTITTENRYVDAPIPGYEDTQEGEYAVLTVADTGAGIAPADLERIFEPFYTKKVMGRSGTGLGLAVVWGTVKDHGGYIDVLSKENKGSAFTLYFPATREDLSKGEQDLSPDEYHGRGESILIVDDVEAQRMLAATILEGLNYRVATAASGEDAVAYLRVNKADLVVLDMIMAPGIDGLETYRRILEIRPRQKAIIVSGFAKTDRVGAAQKLGAGEYVKKPYVIEKLGIAVRKELDRE